MTAPREKKMRLARKLGNTFGFGQRCSSGARQAAGCCRASAAIIAQRLNYFLMKSDEFVAPKSSAK